MPAPEAAPGDRILVGQVLRAHGVRGEVSVASYSDNPARFAAGQPVLVARGPGDETETMVVATARPQPDGRLLVRFVETPDRTQAEALRGARLFAAAGDVGAPPEGSYWERDLVGLGVDDTEGEALGTLTGVLERAAQDLWEVTTPGGRAVLVPAVAAFVKSVDLEARRIVLDPPAGLFAD